MVDVIRYWFRNNGGIIFASLFGAFAGIGLTGIIWGVTLADRVAVIEQRGSPAVEALERRLSRVEERQRIVIENLGENSKKLDRISDDLHKHEVNQGKP